jgi:hypothetical protein
MFSTPAAQRGFLLASHMSEDTASSPENSAKPAAKNASKVRRISTPRPKKVAKSAAPEEPITPAAAELPSIPFPAAPAPEGEEPLEVASQPGADWPEPEAASNGGSAAQSEPNKRKRRRRKGKGQNSAPQQTDAPAHEETTAQNNGPEAKSPDATPEQRPRPQQQSQPQRSKIDPEILTKMAWKIYLAEVSEEGVALIGDNDAKDLSRRCFRLAEIFIEEQSRHR